VARFISLACVGLSLLLSLNTSVRASGLGAPLIGTVWSGVTTTDAAAVHWNPSLLADLPGFQLQLDGNLAYARIAYQRERRAQYQHADGLNFALPLEPHELDPARTGVEAPVEANMALPVGSLFASYRIIDGLSVGLGAYAGFAAPLQLPHEGSQRYHVQEAFILGLYITPAIAWRPIPQLSIGAGLNVVVGSMALRQRVDLAATPLLADVLANDPINQPNDFGPDAPPAVRELDALGRDAAINGAMAVGVSFNVGVTINPIDQLTIGLTYQHGVDLTFVGDLTMDFDHDLFTKDLAFQGLSFPPIVKGKAYVELPLPASARLGIAWRPMALFQWHVQASYVRYSVVERLSVTIESEDLVQESLGLGSVATITMPRRWRDTAEVETLFEFQVNETLRLGVRGGYHSPASPDETVDLTSIDGHRVVAGIVGSLTVGPGHVLTLGAHLHQLISRRVVASDHDRGNGRYELTLLNVGGAYQGSF